ncbi:unnamed protein product [Brassica rapa subsp. narinosa]
MGVDLNHVEREHESSQTKLTIEDLLIKTHILTNLASEEKTNSGYKEESIFYNYSLLCCSEVDRSGSSIRGVS